MTTFDPRHKSRTLYEGRDRAPARSYMKAIGFDDGQGLSERLVPLFAHLRQQRLLAGNSLEILVARHRRLRDAVLL